MSLFAGFSGFPLTPTDEEEHLNPDLWGGFERIVAAGAGLIELLGSTGGYAYLEPRSATPRSVMLMAF